MPDHDLGTAHGKIEIDADVDGVGSAIAQLAALSAAVKALESPVQKLDSAMDKVSETTTAFQRVIQKTTEAASGLASAVSQVAGQVADLTGLTGFLDTAMQKAADATVKAGQAGFKLYGIFRALKNPAESLASVLQTVGYHMFGINKELQQFPTWARSIMKISGYVAAIGVGATRAGTAINLLERGFINLITRNMLLTTGFIGTMTAMSSLYNSSNFLGKGLRAVGKAITDNRDRIRRAYSTLSDFTNGLSKMVVGAALVTSGIKQLGGILRLLKTPPALLGIAAALGAILAVGPVASVLLGVADAVKQLSGALLILPGALAALAPAAGVLLFAFKGVGGAFSAATKDGEEFEKALEELTPGMQNVARAAHSFKDEFSDMKRVLEEGVWHGMSRNIRQLGGVYMPILRDGVEGVAKGLNFAFIELTEFLKQGRTVTDFNRLFGISERVMTNLGKAVRPVFQAFRDIGMVGAEVFEDLTRGAGTTTQRFADFISKARETGKLREWIQEGVQGFRDLWAIIRDVSVGIGDVFRGLGGDGENALARMADSAARFRDAMDGGSSKSGLSEIVQTIQSLSGEIKELITTIWGGLSGALESTARLTQQFTDGFLSGFTTMIAAATGFLDVVSSIVSAFSGFGEVLGIIAGVALAFKGVLLVLKPVIAAMKVLFGMGMIAKGFSSAMLALAVAVETVGLKAGMSTARVNLLTGAMMGLAGAATAVVASLAIVAAAWFSVDAANDAISDSNDAVSKSSENAAASYERLVEAFKSSRGAIDKGVFEAMSEGLRTMRDDLETTADTGLSVWDRIGMTFKEIADQPLAAFSRSESEMDKLGRSIEEKAKAAESAADSFDELGMSNSDLAELVAGTDEQFARLVQRLKETSNGGDDAVQKIMEQRSAFIEIKQAMEDVGPAGLQVSEGLAAIAEEGATATDKLNGLMSVMRGLGLIETTAQEAAMALSEEIAKVAKEAEEQVNVDATMGVGLLDDQGWLKNTEENGRSLYYILQGLRDELMVLASEGGNVQAAFAEMWPELVKVGQQFGFTEEEVRRLVERYGFIPDKIETIMSVAGSDKAKEDLTEVILLLQQAGEKEVRKTITLETQEAVTALQNLGVQVEGWNPRTGTAEITIPQGMGPEVIAEIQALLDGAAAGNPPEITPVIKPPERPEGFIGPVLMEAGEIKQELEAPIQPQILAPDTSALDGALADVRTKIEEINNTQVVIQPGGTEQLEGIQVAVDQAKIKFDEYAMAVALAMQGAITAVTVSVGSINTILGNAATSAVGSGQSLGQGFADGISSKADAVRQAALKLAEAASEPLPRSPAKIGPFSGRGWTPYRGMSLAEGFAQGILQGTPAAQLATLEMARAVADVMDQVRADFNMVGTSFSANRFGEGITNYYRDPEISDRELAENRAEREKAAAEEARKDFLREQRAAADRLPDAEERVFNARERVVNAEERLVKAQERLDKAKTEEAISDAREGLNDAREALAESRIAENEAIAERDKLKGTAAGRLPTGSEGALRANKERTDYINAMNEIAKTFGLEMTSDLRPGDPGWHGTGRAADFSNGSGNTDEMFAFADFMERNFKPFIKELIYDDPRFAGREIKDGQNVDSSYYDDAGDHTNHVHLAVDFAPEFAPGGNTVEPTVNNTSPLETKTTVDPTRTDLTRDEVASIIIARGQAMGMSDTEIKAALATGLVEADLQNLNYGDRDSVGVFQQRNFDEWTKGGTRNRMNVDDAATTFYEQLRGTTGTPGDRAQAVQRSAFPDRYAERMPEAEQIFNRLSDQTGSMLRVVDPAANDELTRIRAGNESIDEALRIAQDPKSTDAQIITALQDLDSAMMNMDELDRDIIEQQKDAIMEDRGIKEYDPYEGALETDYDKFKFGLKAAQDFLGMYEMLKSGLENIGNVAKTLVRGISNTTDVHNLVDGIQGMATTVGEVVGAVGTVVDMVATVAATAGQAIPGIGQVGSIVGAITGGIADVNAVVDLVQDVMKIGGRLFGGALSGLLGGDNGTLYGNVRTLLDFNDNTIKSWSDRNPTDKTVRGMPFTGGQPSDPNQAGGIRDLNIYQGPGTDPREMMNAAMFAVKAHSTGVFAG